MFVCECTCLECSSILFKWINCLFLSSEAFFCAHNWNAVRSNKCVCAGCPAVHLQFYKFLLKYQHIYSYFVAQVIVLQHPLYSNIVNRSLEDVLLWLIQLLQPFALVHVHWSSCYAHKQTRRSSWEFVYCNGIACLNAFHVPEC